DTGQTRPQHFRRREGFAGLEILLRIEPDADAFGFPPAPAFALIRARPRNAFDGQPLHATARAVTADARKTGIHYETDAGHGERSFRHVRGEHDAARGPAGENAFLVARGEPGKERQDFEPEMALSKRICGLANVLLARQEHERVALDAAT